MAHGRARDEQKERQWRQWIAEWRASGLSVRAFCDRRGLATPSFYHWRRVLRRRAAEAAAFVPVQVVADAPPSAPSTSATTTRNSREARLTRTTALGGEPNDQEPGLRDD